MIPTQGYAAAKAHEKLGPFSFERRDPGPNDVAIDILYCGVCHTDIHQARNEWGGSTFPMVPGHEIIGKVARIGTDVENVKVGDSVGVGVMIDSCRTCANCRAGEEQYCENGITETYNSPDRKHGGTTYGGYSNKIVVDEAFVYRLSPKLKLEATAPLLCAGITTYSPLRHWKVGKGQKVGIIGLGGLGHMGLKFAHSFGAHVVQFTTSESKREDALRLGADEVVLSKDPDAMKAHTNSFDFVLDTVSGEHDLNAYLSLLKLNGAMVLVGLPPTPPTVEPGKLIVGRHSLSGSMIGGVKETQEMLDYCAEHGIASDVEVIPIQQINEAFERTVKGDVKYRFVIDMSSLPKQ